MVVFDANMLIALVSPATSDDDRARLEHLIATLGAAKSYVGIPAPAYAEFFVDGGQATSPAIDALRKRNWIRFMPMDEKSSVETALITRGAMAMGGKRRGSRKTWQQIKVDRQIVGIAKAHGAAAIYSDDEDLRKEALSVGIPVIQLSEIALPPEAKQLSIPLEPRIEADDDGAASSW